MIESNSIIKVTRGENVDYIQFNKLLELGVNHAYTLRRDGIDFSNGVEAEEGSYKMLCDELGMEYENLAKPHQNHTRTIQIIDKPYKIKDLPETDGLMTNKENIVLATVNADCILYLVYDKNRKVIANIHSGWKGTYKRIIEKGISMMIEEFGSNPEDIIVCSCPSIRGCHFEVDEEVKNDFEEKFKFLDLDFIEKGNIEDGKQKYHIDTIKLNTKLLTDLGILKENIIDSGICSVCNKDEVYSYRADGEGFRRATAVITLK